jgi:hypothetical protein
MLGLGIYLADMISKVRRLAYEMKNAAQPRPVCRLLLPPVSWNPSLTSLPKHIRCSLSDNTGLLLLCEAVAKPFYERTTAVSLLLVPVPFLTILA